MALDSGFGGFKVNCNGGGNNEADCYTQDNNNLFLDCQSHLVMQVLKISGLRHGKTYARARITTPHRLDYLVGQPGARLKISLGSGV